MSLVLFERIEGNIGVITLNDPDRLNAMSEKMAGEFRETVKKLEEEKPKVLLITGAGRAFSAGGDLQMLKAKQKGPKERNRNEMLEYYSSFLCVRDLGVPLIAAINGHAIGAGLCLAAACDIRIAADTAKLGMTFVKLGLHPGMGATYFLPKIMGYAKALEFMLTAKVISADEALRLNLVSKVVPTDSLKKEALDIASQISGCGPMAVRELLHTLRHGSDSLQGSLSREAEVQSTDYLSEEFNEGLSAVIEKRQADFSKFS